MDNRERQREMKERGERERDICIIKCGILV